MSQEFTPEQMLCRKLEDYIAEMALPTAQWADLTNFLNEQFHAYAATLRQPAARVDEVCEGCNGHGEVGGLTPQGYDSQECPFCHGTGKEAALSAQPAPERQGEVVAWTVVGPDGKSSIGGWIDMRYYETAKGMAVLREGHSYAFAYTHPAAPVGVPDGLYLNACEAVESWKARALKAEEVSDRLMAEINNMTGPTFMGEPVLPKTTPDVKAMVDRFLGWRLPDDFAPDAGISFEQPRNPHWWPTGTNLLTATQASAMFEYVLAAAPSAPQGTQQGEGE